MDTFSSIITYDATVQYKGPSAYYATLTGSPLWSIGSEITDEYVKRGWTHIGDSRPETPYGQGPLVQHFMTADGKNVIRVPSYGMVLDEDWNLRPTWHKLFWILWKAGVQVVLIGGTSGIADWREKDQRIQPGDMVLPWSFKTWSQHRGLPGTEFEMAWPRHDITLEDPFCLALSDFLAELGRNLSAERRLGAVHTRHDVRAALVMPVGITFETDYDIQFYNAVNKMISQMSPQHPPVVTLHGDCLNVVLARMLNMHVGYYHLVANVAQGLESDEPLIRSVRRHNAQFAPVALDLEVAFFKRLVVPTGENCSCLKTRTRAPEEYLGAMTHGEYGVGVPSKLYGHQT